MRVQFVKRENDRIVERGYVYDVLAIDDGWYKIVDDMGDECLYPPRLFDVIEENPKPPVINSAFA